MKRCNWYLPLLLLSVMALPLGAQTTRNVLLEQFTGTWCQWCPDGADTIKAILARIPTARALAYHNQDAMATIAGDEVTDSSAVPGFPAASIDRIVWGINGNYYYAVSTRAWWGGLASTRAPATSPLSIGMSGFYDTTTAILSVTISIDVLAAMTGSYALHFVVSEDSVNYPQKRIVGSTVVTLNPYWHMNAVRDVTLGQPGEMLTTNGFTQGQKLTRSVAVQFLQDWDYRHCKMTAFVDRVWPISYGHREVQQMRQERIWNNASMITFVPVQLEAFTASRTAGAVRLAWRAAEENNNRGWSIERAADDGGWATLAFVDGRGTAHSASSYGYLDESVVSGRTYTYRLRQIDFDGTESVSSTATVFYFDMPVATRLHQNYPNPFNPSTEITAELAESGRVLVVVYDAMGRKVATVANGDFAAGVHRFTWNGADDQKRLLPAGLYLCTMTTGTHTETRQMILAK
ncbi:MAG: T9SS type A sorting domain-containing protein [Ignavibacteria bacterium]|nr:T9SS type A sorting domain-containing protein [Ignavibacteria bacterium]